MSADQSEATPGEKPEAGEQQGSERAARLILLAVLLLAMWGIVAVLPETAYVVVGVLGTIGVQRFQAWRAGRREETAEEEPGPDVATALRRLLGDDKGVLLTRLRDDLKAPDTKFVKALLAAEGIPWKAVRTREGNGPAVHRDDIPSPPPPADGGCCCRSDDNANTNNAAGEGPGEGLRVEHIGQSAYIVRDPAEATRHHTVRGK